MIESSQNPPKFWYTRGYLPHFDGGAINQFITFRLADSLPQNILRQLKIEVERSLISDIEYARKIEKWLDQNRGACHLKDERIADLLVETLKKFDGEKYKLLAWVIMPNHVHLLLRPIGDVSLSEIMHSIKSFTAHKANKILQRKGQFWSKEYFDRFIRDYHHFLKTIDYIENNPVKAGLCPKRSDWRYGSAYGADGGA